MDSDIQVDAATDVLRQLILDGEYGRSGRLPSLNLLAKELRVGRNTANSAVQRLQAEGLLVSKGRAGVFVNKPRPRIPANLARFDVYLERQGLKPVVADIEGLSVFPAPAYAARSMGIDEGAPVVHRLRRIGSDMTPYCLVEDFYPVELVEGALFDRAQRDAHVDILQALQEERGRIAIVVHEDVIGRLPSSREQRLLEIVRGAPVQEVNRVYLAEDTKTILLYSRLVLVASHFVLSYDYRAPHIS